MDIDIDTKSNFNPKDIFPTAILASKVTNGELVKHNVGVYLQNISKDKKTDLAAIPFKEAEDIGFFKIDFLHLTALDCFESKEEIRALLRIEPDWNLLRIPSVVKKLFQIHDHFDIVEAIKPQSIQELADCIALIRPGKRYLLNSYLKDKKNIRKEIFRKEIYKNNDQYFFKKSHSIAYSATIVLQLHLIKIGLL